MIVSATLTYGDLVIECWFDGTVWLADAPDDQGCGLEIGQAIDDLLSRRG